MDESLRIIIEARNNASKELDSLNRQLGKLSKSFKGAQKEMLETQGRLSKLKSGFAGVGGQLRGLLIGGGIALLGKKIFTLVDNLEKNRVAFKAMLGSGEAANEMLAKLADFAKKTPFQLTDVRENAKLLLAMGIEANKMLPTMKALGDVASGTGAEFKRLAKNFGQVKTLGRLTGRELNDFAVNGVPLLAQLAKQMGVSKSEMQQMISAGKIGFPEVEQAFINMTSAGGMFQDLMQEQSKTIGGMISNIQDSWEQLLETFADTSGFQVMKEMVAEFAKFADGAGEATESINTISAAIATLFLLIKQGFTVSIAIIKSFGKLFGGLAAAIVLAIEGDLAGSSAAMNGALNEVKETVTSATISIGKDAKRIEKAWKPMAKAVVKDSKGIGSAIADAKNEIEEYSKTTKKETEKVIEKYSTMRAKASEQLEKLRKNHEKSVDKIIKKSKKLKDTLAGISIDIGTSIIDQEQKVKDLQEEVFAKGVAGESTLAAFKELQKEKKALEAAKGLVKSDPELQKGLADARGLAEQGAFATAMENSLLKRDAIREELVESQAALVAETSIFEAKKNTLMEAGAAFQQFDENGSLAMADLANNTALSVDKMIADIARLKAAMSTVNATGFSSSANVTAPVSSGSTTSNTTNNNSTTSINNNVSGTSDPAKVAKMVTDKISRDIKKQRIGSS